MSRGRGHGEGAEEGDMGIGEGAEERDMGIGEGAEEGDKDRGREQMKRTGHGQGENVSFRCILNKETLVKPSFYGSLKILM